MFDKKLKDKEREEKAQKFSPGKSESEDSNSNKVAKIIFYNYWTFIMCQDLYNRLCKHCFG